MLRWTGLLALLSLAPAFGCVPVSGDRILAQDLAGEIPEFAALAGNTVLGYAPLPGAVRVFERAELESIARVHRINLGGAEKVCFCVPQVARLPEAETVAAMRLALPPSASLELLELPKFPVPAGEIVFPLEAIEPPQPADPSVQNWKGYVRYARSRRFPVWAHVRITLERPTLTATRTLKPGDTIGEDAVRVISVRGPLRPEQTVSTVAEALGKIVLHSIKAGEPVRMAVLEQAPAIRRGDAVKVEVVNGSAILQFSAIAETSARTGEPVQLRNPFSGKLFRARAGAAGRAVLSIENPLSGKSE